MGGVWGGAHQARTPRERAFVAVGARAQLYAARQGGIYQSERARERERVCGCGRAKLCAARGEKASVRTG
eukprot:7104222-Prymnesium_polylepis.1